MDARCPVTYAYLSVIGRLTNFRSPINDMYFDRYQDLLEKADRAGCERVCTHQRAFFAVEQMYVFVVKQALRSEQRHMHVPWCRTREGLTDLIRIVSEEQDLLTSLITESKMERRLVLLHEEDRVRVETDKVRDAPRVRMLELIKLTVDSAAILRQSLKNPKVSLARVGKRLALATCYADKSTGSRVHLGLRLLEQSDTNVERAWVQSEIPRA